MYANLGGGGHGPMAITNMKPFKKNQRYCREGIKTSMNNAT